MKIHLISIGQRMPPWVSDAYDEYAKRLPADYQLILKSLPAEKRLKSTHTQTIMEQESSALLKACPPNTLRIAFDRQGDLVDTMQLSQSLRDWHDQAQDIALLIGGPEGIAPATLQQSEKIWSLSKLTLPHPLVRVVVTEQIYRAWSIIAQHPYHR